MKSKVFISIDYTSLGIANKKFFNATNDLIDRLISFENVKSCLISTKSDLANNVRKVIEKFVNHFDNIEIVDAGYFDEKQLDSLQSSLNQIIENGCAPIILGIDNKFISNFIRENQYSSFQIANNLPDINDSSISNKSFIAFQRHLCTLNDLHKLEESSYNSLSLGKLRSNANLLEPSFRDAEVVVINLNAIRSSDAPNINDALPSGLNVEELCQISKFVGMSNRLKAVFIQTDVKATPNMPEASLIAETLWYLYEGLNMKINDHPTSNKDYSSFLVHLNDIDLDIEFVRNNQSFKWWLKMENSNQENEFLACSYEEYQQAISNEIPERILKFINSLS